MRGLVDLAWRNLSRYRKRTLITAIALGVGLGIFIFIDAWLLGIQNESEQNLVRYETSAIRIVASAYKEKMDKLPLKERIENPGLLIQSLEKGGFKASPRIRFGGEMIFYKDPFPEDGALGVRIVALDPQRDDRVFKLKDQITSGRYLKPGAPEAVLGSWLARDVGAQVGFPLIVETKDRFGVKQTLDLTVVGLITTGNPVINRGSIFIPLDLADEALDMGGGVTEINVALDDYKKAPEVISQGLPGVSGPEFAILSWRDLAADYLAVSSTKQGSSKIILLLVIIIAAVGISNTMLMAVFERIREVGMLRALGMTTGEIRRLFIWEAAGIGALGGLFGMILGLGLVTPFVIWGLDLGSWFQNMDIGFRVASVFRAEWNPLTFIGAFAAGILVSVTVAWFTLRKMLRWDIAQSLTHQ